MKNNALNFEIMKYISLYNKKESFETNKYFLQQLDNTRYKQKVLQFCFNLEFKLFLIKNILMSQILNSKQFINSSICMYKHHQVFILSISFSTPIICNHSVLTNISQYFKAHSIKKLKTIYDIGGITILGMLFCIDNIEVIYTFSHRAL